MKNLSQMVSRLVLAILLVAVSSSYSEAKPKKIVKGITFTGEVVKGMPYGYGTLVITNKEYGHERTFMGITGTFDNGKISNGKIEYCSGEKTDKLSTNVIEGDFSYSVVDKWGKITINISSATIHGVKTINLGSIELEHDRSIPRCEFYRDEFYRDGGTLGELYLPMPKNNLNDIIRLVGHNPSESYLTNYSYALGRYSSRSLLEITMNDKNILKFSDGSILEYYLEYSTYYNGKFSSPKGDVVNFERNPYHTPPYELREFTITDSQGNIYKGKGSGGWVGKNELKLNIRYSDRSKFDGMVMTDFLDKEHVGLELFCKMKQFTKSSIKYYKGTYTDASGATTEYIDGVTKEEYEKRLQAKRMQEEERQRQMQLKIEQEKRESEQYNRTHPLKHRRCTNCQGTGRCPTCNGRGWFIHPMNNERMQCGYCLYKGICPTCSGDGIEDYR